MSQVKSKELHLVLQQSSLVNIIQRLRYEDPYLLGSPKAESAVFIMAGKKFEREIYGGIVENPPIYPGHNYPE